MKKVLAIVAILILVSAQAFAAGSICTVTSYQEGNVRFVNWAWTSDDATGAVSCAAVTITGLILGVKFTPAAADTVPSDQWDVTLTNIGGADMLMGVGANVSNDDSQTTLWKKPENSSGGPVVIFRESATLNVTNAGNSKTGSVTLGLY
jgi:hypothetical protein